MPLLTREMDDVDRFQLILSYFMQLIVLMGIVIFAVRGNWVSMVACIGILFIPFFLQLYDESIMFICH